MKKTILAGAVMLAVGTVASAATVIDKDTTWSGTYGVGEYQVKGDASLTNETANTVMFQSGAEGTTSVKFDESATLKLESAYHIMLNGDKGKIDVSLGNSGRLEMTSNQKEGILKSMLAGNVSITGGTGSYLKLETKSGESYAAPLGDSHIADSEVVINVDKLDIISAGGRAIVRQNPTESLKITARDIYVEGRVQQGGNGSTEINGFDTLTIDGGSNYAVVSADGELTIKGKESSEVTLKASGTDAVIGSRSPSGKLSIDAKTIRIENTGEAGVGIAGGESGASETAGTVTLTADSIQVTATHAVNVNDKGGNFTMTANELNLNGNVTTLGGTLGVNATRATVTGDIKTTNTKFALNGELQFKGNTAEIDNLTGDSATFTLTKADQSVTINNANKALTVAATGDLNDEVGMDAFKNLTVGGDAKGVQVVAREGMYTGETTGVLNEKGEIVQTVTGANSIMSNVLDLASASTLSLNRILMNDVRKRMGDLRASEGTHGVWARYDGGKFSGSNSFENDFSTVQIGADTAAFLDGTRLGVAFSYTTSDSDMQRGDAEMDAYSLAFYGTKFFENGMFVDVIGRLATIDTDVTIDGNKKGNLDNMAVSLSGEFGWRFDVNQSFYVEPQAEVTYTYLDSDKLKLSSGHEYELDSVDSLIGRLGFATGFKCPNNFGDVYLRASAVHEFLGDAAVHGGTYTLETDGDDTWIEFGVGANFNLNKNLYGYVDLERTEGADLDEDWRANVGVRYSF